MAYNQGGRRQYQGLQGLFGGHQRRVEEWLIELVMRFSEGKYGVVIVSKKDRTTH